MQRHAPSQEPPPPQNLEMSLREHLLAQAGGGSGPPPYPPAPNTAAQGPPPPAESYQNSDSGSMQQQQQQQPQQQLDPNVTGQMQPFDMDPESTGEDGLSPNTAKGKRELSTSKRAAQNRAAQRAFRQRKEGYIKKLEERVKEGEIMDENFRALQNENYQLRDYILNLQNRLLEQSADFPPAPNQIDLHAPAQAVARMEQRQAERAYEREPSQDQQMHDTQPQPPTDQERRELLEREMQEHAQQHHYEQQRVSEQLRHDAMTQAQQQAPPQAPMTADRQPTVKGE